MKRRIAIIAAVGGALAALALWFASALRTPTVRVEPGPIEEHVVARAALVPGEGVSHVYANTAGKVVRVAVRAGDRVKAGQTLLEQSVGGKVQPLTAAETAVVMARHVEVGDYARTAEQGASEPLFELADPRRAELRVEVDEADSEKLALGQHVEVTTAAQKEPLQGQIASISGRLEPRSIGADDARVRAGSWVQVAWVKFAAGAPDWSLEMRAEARIEIRKQQVSARVPRSAIHVRDGRTVVDEAVGFWSREVPVEVVDSDDAWAAVRGIAPGARVLAH